jgi:hypothetical protein
MQRTARNWLRSALPLFLSRWFVVWTSVYWQSKSGMWPQWATDLQVQQQESTLHEAILCSRQTHVRVYSVVLAGRICRRLESLRSSYGTSPQPLYRFFHSDIFFKPAWLSLRTCYRDCGCLRTGRWGEYLDLRGMKWQEVGENCITVSSIIWILLIILLGRSDMFDGKRPVGSPTHSGRIILK